MSEIRTFSLENLKNFGSDFRRSDFVHSVRLIVRLYYKRPKFEQIWTFVWSSRSTEHPKSEPFDNRTKTKSVEIRTFRFQTFTVYGHPKIRISIRYRFQTFIAHMFTFQCFQFEDILSIFWQTWHEICFCSFCFGAGEAVYKSNKIFP